MHHKWHGDCERANTADVDESVNPGNNLFVEKVQIMHDPHTRESRGFAFVTMVRPEDAEAAMQVLNSFELHGRAMSVNMARRGRARTPTPGQYRGPPKRERGMGMPYNPYDRRADRFDPRYDPRGPDPREYRGAPMRADYARPGPYDRWMGGARPRYDDRPPRDYRGAPFDMGRGYDERAMYDRGYDRRAPSRYDERYERY
ncbi:hypothetical protein BGZ95_002026 [Linnemannia exigua]|uniref:RRM domain-containing protein n=1 Tax=Linnemannia exigua TaxID=604196 RepID=A0AAD4D6H0_9FUNG|nr:hypothetical protein BGZ95_002026 [Linnemannia exigua]